MPTVRFRLLSAELIGIFILNWEWKELVRKGMDVRSGGCDSPRLLNTFEVEIVLLPRRRERTSKRAASWGRGRDGGVARNGRRHRVEQIKVKAAY